jgi:hypothetical protein
MSTSFLIHALKKCMPCTIVDEATRFHFIGAKIFYQIAADLFSTRSTDRKSSLTLIERLCHCRRCIALDPQEGTGEGSE